MQKDNIYKNVETLSITDIEVRANTLSKFGYFNIFALILTEFLS